eukprot:354058-Chlamydomonas_euryale.AAC.7
MCSNRAKRRLDTWGETTRGFARFPPASHAPGSPVTKGSEPGGREGGALPRLPRGAQLHDP